MINDAKDELNTSLSLNDDSMMINPVDIKVPCVSSKKVDPNSIKQKIEKNFRQTKFNKDSNKISILEEKLNALSSSDDKNNQS